MATSETLRSVIDTGRSSKRLDELSSARVIGKVAMLAHAEQQKAGHGKAVGPITPSAIQLQATGQTTLALADKGSSLGYSAPEQISGGAGDRRSDVFSLGCVLWEALTHQRLFDAMNDAAVKVAVQEREIQPPSEVNANIPAELSAICMRALSRNPSDRYQSLKAMAVELEEFLDEAGYGDDDSRITQYLATMQSMPRSKPATAQPPLTQTQPLGSRTGTQPPPSTLRPAASTPVNGIKAVGPSMLTDPPVGDTPRPKTNSGAALAAALANASGSGLPGVVSSTTAIGVPAAPVASDWQDTSAPAHAPPPPAAPSVPLTASADLATTPTAQPSTLIPMPPVLPGSSGALRNDKATIAVSVPPQVKVATTGEMKPLDKPDEKIVEAKHVEGKPQAVLVDDKPQAMIVDEPDPRSTLVDAVPAGRSEAPPMTSSVVAETNPENVKTQPAVTSSDAVVDALVARPVDNKTEPSVLATEAKPPENKVAVETKPAEKPAEPVAPVETKADAMPAEPPKPAETKPAESAPRTRAPSQSGGAPREATTAEKSAPHPASVVALGNRDSRGDLLAGWGWGTDKHDAIAPAGYNPDDDDDQYAPSGDSKKTLTYVIGGGLAVALLITIVAFAAGGSSSSKGKKNNNRAATAQTEAAAKQPAPAPTPAPVPETPTQPAVDPARDEAAKAEAARVEAENEALLREADETVKALAEQERAAADKAAQEEAARLAKEQAAADKAAKETAKEEAARLAKEKAAADKAAKEEATRVAKEKAAADKAAKAEAARIAKEKAAANRPKTTASTDRPKTTKKTEPKTVAKVEPTAPTGETKKLDVETAYRIGLQQFARGDTAGALASLRTSLAGNPNYAPTWRGLGLVFEKMGEKDQAKAAYKRYLQLAPSAGDAEIIRGRLGRLGS